MIKVLIVEDSPVVRDLLTFILSSDPAIQVIGTASDGEEAVRAVREKRPDVVTMDIVMPKMDGFEATRIIMETTPTPIVIVSASWDSQGGGKDLPGHGGRGAGRYSQSRWESPIRTIQS